MSGEKYRELHNHYKKLYLKYKGGSIKGKELPAYIIQNKFPVIQNVDRDEVMVAKDNIKLMAGNDATKVMADIIENRMGSNIEFTNITPNIGSDLINFTFRFQKPIAIIGNESEETKKMLKHNLDLYNLNIRVKVHDSDILKTLKKIEQDVLYIDGFFLESKDRRIYLGKHEISELVEMFKERVKMFAFRVPVDYDFNHMFTEISTKHYEVFSFKEDDVSKEINFFMITVLTDQIVENA